MHVGVSSAKQRVARVPIFVNKDFCLVAMPAANRVFCLELSGAERSDIACLVAFASKVPAAKQSGDSVEASEAKMRRKPFQRIISLLWRNPEISGQCCDWVEDKVIQLKHQQGGVMIISPLGQCLEHLMKHGFVGGYFGGTKKSPSRHLSSSVCRIQIP